VSALATDVRGAGLNHLASAVACAVVLMMLVAQGYGHPLPIIIGAIAGVTVAAQRSAGATLFPPFRGRARDLPVIIRTRSPAAVRRSVLATIATLVVGVLVASTSVESLSLWPAAFSAVLAATYASAGIWALEELQVRPDTAHRTQTRRPAAAVALALLMFAIALAAVGYLGWTLWQWRELDTGGASVSAAVLAGDTRTRASATYTLRIAFEAGGTRIEDRRCVTRETYTRAVREARVEVRYLPNDPKTYRVGTDEGCFSPNQLGLVAAVFAVMGGQVLTVRRAAR